MSHPQAPYPLDQWYVAAHAAEVTSDRLLARTVLGQRLVLFRDEAGRVVALEDRCVHRSLPLSMGTLEAGGVRCGYHGMLFDASGLCVDIPGQQQVPARARVPAWTVREQDGLVWCWCPREGAAPTTAPPRYTPRDDARYEFRSGVLRYDAPWQLVHDNLLDLTHVGYVHQKTIGGIPRTHSEAPTKVWEQDGTVRVRRELPNTPPPPTFRAAWPFEGQVDRWQEIVFQPSHVTIFACAIDAGSGDMTSDDPPGLQIPSLHAVTPETEHSCHYFWTIGINRAPGRASVIDTLAAQFEATFLEDFHIINAQYRNQRAFAGALQVDGHMDAAANRARRLVERLSA